MSAATLRSGFDDENSVIETGRTPWATAMKVEVGVLSIRNVRHLPRIETMKRHLSSTVG